MKDYTQLAWKFISDKLGSISEYIEPVARSVKKGVSEGTVGSIGEASLDIRRLAVDLQLIADFLDDAIEDGSIDLYEGANALRLLNRIIIDGEDVFIGISKE